MGFVFLYVPIPGKALYLAIAESKNRRIYYVKDVYNMWKKTSYRK